MNHDVRELVSRELAEMPWTQGMTRQALADHFRMAPTIRNMFEQHLPDRVYSGPEDVLSAVPAPAWEETSRVIAHGSPENHYLRSRAAHFNIRGETPGFGHITEQEQSDHRHSPS